jgi:hypothetical protein
VNFGIPRPSASESKSLIDKQLERVLPRQCSLSNQFALQPRLGIMRSRKRRVASRDSIAKPYVDQCHKSQQEQTFQPWPSEQELMNAHPWIKFDIAYNDYAEACQRYGRGTKQAFDHVRMRHDVTADGHGPGSQQALVDARHLVRWLRPMQDRRGAQRLSPKFSSRSARGDQASPGR